MLLFKRKIFDLGPYHDFVLPCMSKMSWIKSAYDQNNIISIDDYYNNVRSFQFENRTSSMTSLQV